LDPVIETLVSHLVQDLLIVSVQGYAFKVVFGAFVCVFVKIDLSQFVERLAGKILDSSVDVVVLIDAYRAAILVKFDFRSHTFAGFQLLVDHFLGCFDFSLGHLAFIDAVFLSPRLEDLT
jgi:hypothetical protein